MSEPLSFIFFIYSISTAFTSSEGKIKNKKDKPGKTAEDKIDLRKTQSSAPIEIMKVDGKLNSDKTKKKGWWST